MRIGLVDLDTSHAAAFVPVLRALGHDVVGVFDGASVHEPGYAEVFAQQHRIASVYTSLVAMATDVDAAFVLGCDWNLHTERVAPFAAAGAAVFVDKPIAGTTADLRRLAGWSRQGVRIAGGSSLRWAAEVAAWRARQASGAASSTSSTGSTATASWPGHHFEHGVHAFSLLHGLLGPGLRATRALDGDSGDGGDGLQRFEVRWADDRRGLATVGPRADPAAHPTTVTTATDSGRLVTETLTIDHDDLYRALLAATLPYLAGQAPPPLPFDVLVEPELAGLAGELSAREAGRWVGLDEPALDSVRIDSSAFVAAYRSRSR